MMSFLEFEMGINPSSHLIKKYLEKENTKSLTSRFRAFCGYSWNADVAYTAHALRGH